MFIGEDEKLHEECGVFGVIGDGIDVASLSYYGLFALQHRGQEGCGIAALQNGKIALHKGLGLVAEVFNRHLLATLSGEAAIGHVRYSTTGENIVKNTQPMCGMTKAGEIALAHNGNLSNTESLRARLAERGSVFQTEVDTELIVHLIASYPNLPLHEAIAQAMKDLEGSYAIVCLNKDKLYAARDPFGNRPLCIGELPAGGYVVASESCALDTVGAHFIRDVQPGEILILTKYGINSYKPFPSRIPRHCIFEYVYFARPDSTLDGISVNVARRKMGEALAREISRRDIDVVIPVPDSGTTAAIGLAQAMNVPFTQGILKNRYAGRTFIQPTQDMREIMVSLKLNPIAAEIKGKSVAVVDDSIVRGTTSRRLIHRLRAAGAGAVHFYICCPPVKYPCYYGIDTGRRKELIANTHSHEEIRAYIGADSLNYLSLKGLCSACGREGIFCTACLDGEYFTEIKK